MQLQNFINGQFVEPLGKQYLDSLNPATAQVNARVPDSAANDVELAVAAAERAFVTWSKLSRQERSQYMLKIADGIAARMHEFAVAES